ncbi:MAG: hypothetical protein RIG63_22215 [Coleofasciculus chthonoplastes F3-SA18-01]
MKNLSNVETHKSEYECDRTLPATHPLNPTPACVILSPERSEGTEAK